MGHYYKFLVHEGMNSTSNEKGTDGKKNNTSAYNHDYYMKNKEKWQGKKTSKSAGNDAVKELSNMSGMEEKDCEELLKLAKSKGYDSPEYKELLEILSEGDSDQAKRMEAVVKKNAEASKKKSSSSGSKEFDVDSAAKDVISGKYGNGEERKKALGSDYDKVQKRVNELLKHSEGDDEDVLQHHGIRGQKWGVRRYQNADGTLTSAGRKRYGEGGKNAFSAKAATYKALSKSGLAERTQKEANRKAAEKIVSGIEKYSTRAANWENKAANAKTRLGRNFSTSFAIDARKEADKRAARATGESKGDLLGLKKRARELGSEAETYANIANKMKENAKGKTGKEYEKAMNKAISNLATAENKETYAKAYKDAANQKGIINKGVAYFNNMDAAKNTRVTDAGRMQTKGDKRVEAIGDNVLSVAFGITTNGNATDTSGFTERIRDTSYKKKYSADERWDKLAK